MELEEAIERLEYLMQDIEHRKMDCEAIYVVNLDDYLKLKSNLVDYYVNKKKENKDNGDLPF